MYTIIKKYLAITLFLLFSFNGCFWDVYTHNRSTDDSEQTNQPVLTEEEKLHIKLSGLLAASEKLTDQEKKTVSDHNTKALTENKKLEGNFFAKSTLKDLQLSNLNFNKFHYEDPNDPNVRNFSNPNFTETKIENSTFTKCDLKQSLFAKTNFINSSFIKTNLDHSNFISLKENILNKTLFEDCSLKETNFRGAVSPSLVFSHCHLNKSKFNFTVFSRINFNNSDLTSAKIEANGFSYNTFENANLEGAEFELLDSSNIYTNNFKNSKLKNTTFILPKDFDKDQFKKWLEDQGAIFDAQHPAKFENAS